MLYCEYTPVECPARDCRLHIAQKDFHKGCLHYTVSCEDCHTSLMKKDLEVSSPVTEVSALLNTSHRNTSGTAARIA
jgi:hypothetical protein